LPAGLFSGLDALRSVVLHTNALRVLPEGLFDGVSGTLTLLALNRNPVSFTLPVDLEQQASGRVRARVLEAAPIDIRVTWNVPGSGATGTVIIRRGQRTSDEFGTPETAPEIRLTGTSFMLLPGARTLGIRPVIASASRPGLIVNPTRITMAEGGTVTYTVLLNTAPTGGVAVRPTVVPGPGSDTLTTSRLVTFSGANWRVARTVTVTAAMDADLLDHTITITHTVSGYGSITTAGSVEVTILDNTDAPVFGVTTLAPRP